MLSPLLTTKLYVPPARLNRVPRPRLNNQLNIGRPVTILAAPAGFGKTTALSEWIPTSQHCVTWVALDDGDNDPVRFWMYVIAALQRLRPDLGANALTMLQLPQSPPITSILTTFINDITSFPEAFSLVLDDYHLIKLQAIQESLTFLLDHLPPRMRIILSTRADPPLPLARLRARDQLTELRAHDLRFTPDEAAKFLNQVMGLSLSTDDIATLESRTEGWIAGLQLAALSMQGHADISGFIQSFSGSHRHVLTYLAEDVLDQHPEGTVGFLLQTSVLERLCGPLCDAVTGQRDGHATLAKLEHANLFIMPLDDTGQWFRYHHLFAEVLRARLQLSQPDMIPELHLRASAWYEQNGLIVESIYHALEVADNDAAVRLIESIGMMVFVSGVMQYNLQTWLGKLPDSVVRSRPKLCLIHAWLLLNQGSFTDALERVDEGEQALQHIRTAENASEAHNLSGELAATRAIIVMSKGEFDAEQIITWSEAALAELHPQNLTFQSAALGASGVAYLRLRDVRRAEQSLAEAVTTAQAGGSVYMTVAAVVNLAQIQRARGDIRAAQTTCLQCLDWLAERGVSNWPNAGGVHANLAALFCEVNDMETALRHAKLAIEMTGQGTNPPATLMSLVALARVKEIQQDWDAILGLLRQIEQLQSQVQIPWLRAHWPSIHAHFYLAQGKVADASVLLRKNDVSRDVAQSLDLLWACEYDWITPVQVWIAQARGPGDEVVLVQALATLERLLQRAEALGLVWLQVKVHALCSLAHSSLGNPSQAQSSLERALTLAAPEGYIRTFVDEGEPMQEAIKRWRLEFGKRKNLTEAQTRLMAYADKLLGALSENPPGLPTPDQAGNSLLYQSDHIEPLSARELQVLHLIAEGLSNDGIAQKLFLSTSTVKVHLKHIYGKLQVHNRTQAVARLRELNLK